MLFPSDQLGPARFASLTQGAKLSAKGSDVSVQGALSSPGILTLVQGPFSGNLWRWPPLDCTVSEMKARSCCRSHASTIRVASVLAGLWGSVLRHVNAEQQVMVEVAVSLSL